MKTLFCSDLGERTCNFAAEGTTLEAAERMLLDHVEERHPTFIQGMTNEERERLLEHAEAMAGSR